MHPHENCNGWDYEHHPNRLTLAAQCVQLELDVVGGTFVMSGYDTRPAHALMFKPVTPASCKCLAGNFRGFRNCPPLRKYSVSIPGDRRVGVPPDTVAFIMNQFEMQCHKLQAAFSTWRAAETPKPLEAQVLLRFVKILAEVLERFFTIHPYANGNGHIGRFLILVLLTRAGYAPAQWGLDQKQPYGDAITAYRNGFKEPLENFLLDTITI